MKTASRIKMAATVASVMRASTRPGAPGIQQRVQSVPRLVRSTLDGTYAGTTLKRLGLVAGAVAYVASPVDLLPEAVLPVVGAADDAVVIGWAVKAFFEETDRFLAWEMGAGLHRSQPRHSAPWSPSAGAGPEATPTAATGGLVGRTHEPSARAWTGDVQDGLRRDRDTTGAAAAGRIVSRVTRAAAGARARSGDRAGGAGDGRAATGADGVERVRLPEGLRHAATDYVLESVRKRLER